MLEIWKDKQDDCMEEKKNLAGETMFVESLSLLFLISVGGSCARTKYRGASKRCAFVKDFFFNSDI